MSAILCDKLTRVFPAPRHAKGAEGVTAVDHMDLDVAEGEIFCLVGPDGAGKTTTMRLLSSIMRPTSGSASVLGLDVVRDAEAVKEAIGYMSQRFGLYGDLTVAENLDFYGDIYGVRRRDRKERVARLLEFSALAPFQRRLAGNLSGGMKQKLGLCCALIHTPRVLLLDEPTNGVDPVSRRDFWRILYGLLREKVTIFVSTAYLDEAERASRVGLIHKGRLLATGTPAEVKRMARGRVVEIRPSQPRRAAGLLRERAKGDRPLNGVKGTVPSYSVGLFGDRVHLLSDDPRAAGADATRLLAAAGFTVHESREIEPSLEDVFVSVLSENP